MQVRARLAGGLAQSTPWGVALDGLLAGVLWGELRAAARGRGEVLDGPRGMAVPADLELPLARCALGDGTWHWAATCADPEGRPARAPVEVRYWTGRLDQTHAAQVCPRLPLTVSDRRGRYRARRMPLILTPCTAVVWRAVGDVDAVRDLVSRIFSIGKRRSSGEGRVLGWEVQPLAGVPEWDAGHVHHGGGLGRTVPPECLTGRRVPVGGRGRAGLRPPYMHPGRQRELILPVFLDATGELSS